MRTKSMVMGVRGTDFYVDAHNDDGDSTISVIRGKVEITPTVLGETIELESGYTMDIDDRKKNQVVISRNTKALLKRFMPIQMLLPTGRIAKKLLISRSERLKL